MLKQGLSAAVIVLAMIGAVSAQEVEPNAITTRRGAVRIVDHALVDDDGPFLGLGTSYFTALWRCKHDRARLESDLAFLSSQGFNYYRMLSMVGYQPYWDGKEIAPVSFTNADGKAVAAWPDYWNQLRDLVDLAYDKYGLRTQITIFADAQMMPEKADRVQHLRRVLEEVVAGREHKLMMLEVANEAWQNGFPEEQGVADLREFASFLNDRTTVPVAISSNHAWPAPGGLTAFRTLYEDSTADVATWHFSRDLETDDGWLPVYDCWEYAELANCPPISSNEPIGPGASVNAERDPLKLILAATHAYTAKAPMYVFHSAAGVAGKTRFEETPGVEKFHSMLRLLPSDLPNWSRYEANDEASPFTTYCGGKAGLLWTESSGAKDGCIRHNGSRKENHFVALPIGIQPAGLVLSARHDLKLTAYHPVTGEILCNAELRRDERFTLPQGPGALIILGEIADSFAP